MGQFNLVAMRQFMSADWCVGRKPVKQAVFWPLIYPL